MKQKRNLFIDNLKGIAIILVILGHAIQYGSGKNYYDNALFFRNRLFVFIYSFHMPLFMLISGYLFYYAVNKYSWKQIIISRFQGLLLPIFTFSVFMFGSERIWKQNIFQNGFLTVIKQFVSDFRANLWFLWAVFILSFLIFGVKIVFKDSTIIYILIFILSFLYPDRGYFHYYKFMYPFFVIGYFFNKYDRKRILENISWKSIGIGASAFLVLLFFYNYDSYIYTSGHCILGKDFIKQLGIDMYRTVIGFVGSIVVIMLMKIFFANNKGQRIKAVLGIIGQKSIGIYFFSSYIFYYILQNITAGIPDMNYWFIFVETMIILSISLGLTLLVQKNKVLSYLFLGGR